MNNEELNANSIYQSFCKNYNQDIFLEKCKSNCLKLFESPVDGASYTVSKALEAVQTLTPLSMVRIGDGEGNILHFYKHNDSASLKWFNDLFKLMDGQYLTLKEAQYFAAMFNQAIEHSDIIGLRNFIPISGHDYKEAISSKLTGINLRGPVGIMGALNWSQSALDKNLFHDKIVTSAWIHLKILEQLELLIKEAPKIIIISGRTRLKKKFSEKLGSRLKAFISVPLQANVRPLGHPFHYPDRFNETLTFLRTDLRGTLVLIGAGVFGKIYCSAVKANGGVALDIGSAFDILTGQKTRPVHTNPAFLNQNQIPSI